MYISFSATNPSSLFGGIWEQIAQGRCLMGVSTGQAAGTNIDAGLPNIIGSIMTSWYDTTGGGIILGGLYNSGALYSTKDNSVVSMFNHPEITSTQSNHHNTINIDASRSNGIYGKSSTVQPPALLVYMFRRTA